MARMSGLGLDAGGGLLALPEQAAPLCAQSPRAHARLNRPLGAVGAKRMIHGHGQHRSALDQRPLNGLLKEGGAVAAAGIGDDQRRGRDWIKAPIHRRCERETPVLGHGYAA
jgi:hypothetical protein